MKTPALVYSKNRAAQLDLLLRSIRRFAPWVDPTVLWTCRDDHEGSYRVVVEEHPFVGWIRETNFEQQTRDWIAAAGPRFMWLVDDALFYRPATEPDGFPWACRTTGVYRWRDHDPQSEKGWGVVVGGTVYETATILPLLHFPFDNPNQLERRMHARRDAFTPELIHGADQALCSIEHNAVSVDSWNPTMGGDVDELRDLFMQGRRIDLDGLALDGVDTAHVQVPLVWCGRFDA